MRREEIPARPLPHRRLQPEQVETASIDEMASWLVGIEEDVSVLEQNRAVVLSEFENRGGHHYTATLRSFHFSNPSAG